MIHIGIFRQEIDEFSFEKLSAGNGLSSLSIVVGNGFGVDHDFQAMVLYAVGIIAVFAIMIEDR